jgi:hypothetical protein
MAAGLFTTRSAVAPACMCVRKEMQVVVVLCLMHVQVHAHIVTYWSSTTLFVLMLLLPGVQALSQLQEGLCCTGGAGQPSMARPAGVLACAEGDSFGWPCRSCA